MIKKLTDNDNDKIMELLTQNAIANYFIILSLEREKYKRMFKEKWGQFNQEGKLVSVMLRRNTGTLQFYSSQDYDVDEICNILENQDFDKLIAEESIIQRLIDNYNFSRVEKGAFLSKLENLSFKSIIKLSDVKSVKLQDIDRVVDLYKSVFTGFAPRELIIEKYRNNTGRGYYIEKEGRMISIAQSSYESNDSAIIVGVATHEDSRKKGYATECLVKLCEELVNEGKTLYLQYDNPKAGKIYKDLGFMDIGRMVKCFN